MLPRPDSYQDSDFLTKQEFIKDATCAKCQELGIKNHAPGAGYLVTLGARYMVPDIWYQLPGTIKRWHLVSGEWNLVTGTRYIAPGTQMAGTRNWVPGPGAGCLVPST